MPCNASHEFGCSMQSKEKRKNNHLCQKSIAVTQILQNSIKNNILKRKLAYKEESGTCKNKNLKPIMSMIYMFYKGKDATVFGDREARRNWSGNQARKDV